MQAQSYYRFKTESQWYFINKHKMEELDLEASYQLFRIVANWHIDDVTCNSIIKLTGPAALTLILIGTILKSRASVTNAIASIEREFMPTLSYQHFSHDERVSASLNASFKYLKHNLLSSGQCLSYFPGQFSLSDACSVLPESCGDLQEYIDILKARALLETCGDNVTSSELLLNMVFANLKVYGVPVRENFLLSF